MRLLFISAKDVSKKSNGGELCTNRNYESFCKLLKKENVTVINLLPGLTKGITNAISKRINYLSGFYEGLSRNRLIHIIKKSKEHDLVFIDSSIHGAIAYLLKRNNYQGKVICFFHNVEYKIKLQKIRIQPWKLMEVFVIKYNERLAIRHSNICIAVNQRDEKELISRYKARNITIIPISLKDTAKDLENGLTSVPPTFLFVGNNWYANIHGLNWFIDNVLDHVEIKLQITGHKMESLKKKYTHPKIEFLGFVDDLASKLKATDYILSPIFLGSGMKVKTCEALMYAKNIIGTPESFEGYNLNNKKVGAVCNTREEFIQAISKFCSEKRNKYNSYNRNLFLNSYSFEATLKNFKELLELQT